MVGNAIIVRTLCHAIGYAKLGRFCHFRRLVHFRLSYVRRFCDSRLRSYKRFCNTRFNFKKNSRPGIIKGGKSYIQITHYPVQKRS